MELSTVYLIFIFDWQEMELCICVLILQIVIDSCCATFAEVQKRGKDFWAEFELYVADLLVGLVVNVALVGMLAPYARIGKRSVSGAGFLGRIQHAYNSLPSRFVSLGLTFWGGVIHPKRARPFKALCDNF